MPVQQATPRRFPHRIRGERPRDPPSFEGPIDGRLIRRYRHWCGLTQERFAAELGYAPLTILVWENHNRQASISEQALRNLLYGHLCRKRHISVYKGHVQEDSNGERADTGGVTAGTG